MLLIEKSILNKKTLISQIVGSVIVFLMAAALYAPVHQFDFINWDDNVYIHSDAVVLKGLSDESLIHAFSTFDNPYFMPLTRLSFMADVSLFGSDNPGGFHLTNLIIHSINSCLIFLLIFKVSLRFYSALIIAALFALHPQHVEAVAWIAERKELLAGFFGLLSLLTYQQYALTNHRHWYLFSIVTFGLCLFSKPIWVTLPVLLLIWDFFPLKRLSLKTLQHCIIEKIPFFLISGIFSLIIIFTLQIDEASSVFSPPQWHIRWMLPFVGFWDYLGNTLWPINLFPFYAYPDEIHIKLAIFGVMSFFVLFGLLFIAKIRTTYPGLLMAFVWFLTALLPAFSLILNPQGEIIFSADRFSYLPHIGMR